jgi:hypothetical protein
MTALNIEGKKNGRRSLTALKVGSQKRKRYTIERELELSTMFNVHEA